MMPVCLLASAGIASSDYGSLVARHMERGVYHATSSALSVACGRLSYTFGMRGPSVSIDTACSASLVGLHMATKGLEAGEAQASYSSGDCPFFLHVHRLPGGTDSWLLLSVWGLGSLEQHAIWQIPLPESFASAHHWKLAN